MAPVNVSIQYCGGWGYGSRFNSARALIVKEFPSGVDVVPREDSGVTGNFEVSVNGVLVHSKKTQGQGFLHDNAAQQKVVLEAIRAAQAK